VLSKIILQDADNYGVTEVCEKNIVKIRKEAGLEEDQSRQKGSIS